MGLKSYKARIQQNMEHCCIAEVARGEPCPEHRYLMSRFCRRHLQQFKVTGAVGPDARIYRRKFFDVAAEEVRELVEKNYEHYGVTQPIAVLKDILDTVRENRTIPGLDRPCHIWIGNLADRDPDLQEMLIHLSAVSLMYWRKHHSPFADFPNFQRNLAVRFVRFVPGANSGRLKHSSVKKLTFYLYNRIGKYLKNIADGCDAREKAKRRDLEELKKPFNLNDN